MVQQRRETLRSWRRLLQISLTIGLLIYLFGLINWKDLVALVAAMRWQAALLACLSLLLFHLISAVRWQQLLQNPRPTFQHLFSMYIVGVFCNNFLPTGIGGDGVRVTLLQRHIPLSKAIISVGLDRLAGVLALPMLLLAGLWLGLPPGLSLQLPFGTAQALLALLVAVLAALGAGWALWRRRPGQYVRARLRAYVPDQAHARRSWIRLLATGYTLSLPAHLAFIGMHLALMQALQIPVIPAAACWVVFCASLAALVPITVNGIGLFEGIYVVLLGAYGIAAAPALSLALLVRMLLLLSSLPGGLLMLAWGFSPRRSQHAYRQDQ